MIQVARVNCGLHLALRGENLKDTTSRLINIKIARKEKIPIYVCKAPKLMHYPVKLIQRLTYLTNLTAALW